MIRPNKLLYNLFRPSAKFVRYYVHPQSWIGGLIFSSFGIKVKRDNFSGIPGAIFTPSKNVNTKSIIVYLHGGGYCFGSSLTTHKVGLTRLAKQTRLVCYSVDYRLAPEHQYPAALDDALIAWNHIVSQNPNCNIILAGDSAGGGLSLALMMYLRDNNKRLPDGLVLFSPWTDLTCSGETYQTKAKYDPMFTTNMPKDSANNYVPEGVKKTDPYISPLYGSFSNLPRTLILVGENEILLDDSRLFAQKAKESGVDIEIDIWPNMFHDWWLFGSFIPETIQVLDKAANWIDND
ncbi:MAG TPA: alpha/beta hydrolase [Candidatus Poseidoniales archaeon]|nr:MAG TPA: alpha/beta hydrolase [Candidatus Poseidoniales archaeon]|tara:strand:- start:114 stop:989 length:876 start_codon:yes stop_codon:yes gene_type:complete